MLFVLLCKEQLNYLEDSQIEKKGLPLAVNILPLFTEHGQNVCYEDSKEESKTPQICIDWKGYPGENQTCELPNCWLDEKTRRTYQILPAESNIMKLPPTQHCLALCTRNLDHHSLETGQGMILLFKTLDCWHTKWTELSTDKVNQDWSSASLVLTLQCDRLYSIQLRHQQLNTYNIILRHIKKVSNQLYTFCVASPVLSAQRKCRTRLLFSSLCWSSWREVTSPNVCIQSSRYRSHT